MGIKSSIAVAFTAMLLSGGASHAADLAPVESTYDWTGAYIGAHGGYLWGNVDYAEPAFPGYERDDNDGSFIGGALAGYNHQFDSIVLGVDADVGFGGINIGSNTNCGLLCNDYTAFDSDWNAHIRAKLGFAADRALFYVAGGLALADLNVDDTDPGWTEDDATHVGWTIGAGAEYAITDSILIRAEYLYDDYGSENYSFSGDYDYDAKVKLKAQTARIGISFKF